MFNENLKMLMDTLNISEEDMLKVVDVKDRETLRELIETMWKAVCEIGVDKMLLVETICRNLSEYGKIQFKEFLACFDLMHGTGEGEIGEILVDESAEL